MLKAKIYGVHHHAQEEATIWVDGPDSWKGTQSCGGELLAAAQDAAGSTWEVSRVFYEW